MQHPRNIWTILVTSKSKKVVITKIYIFERASTGKHYIFPSMLESINSSALSCPHNTWKKSQWKHIDIIKELWVLNEPCTNKPFMVGLDMAKIAGFVETDSLIALSTWVESQPLKLRNSTAEKLIQYWRCPLYIFNIPYWGMWHDRSYIVKGNYLIIENATNTR